MIALRSLYHGQVQNSTKGILKVSWPGGKKGEKVLSNASIQFLNHEKINLAKWEEPTIIKTAIVALTLCMEKLKTWRKAARLMGNRAADRKVE